MKKQAVLTTLTLFVMLMTGISAQADDDLGPWVSVGLGLNGLAMDDINAADVRWYEDSPTGFNLPEINSGMVLSFGVGYDMSPVWGYGFYYEHQYASAKGTDVDIDGDLNLAAEMFTGRVSARLVRTRNLKIGLVGGLGYLAASGGAKITRSDVSYGEDDISGSGYILDGALMAEVGLGEHTLLDLSAGYRNSIVSEFKLAGAPVADMDGNRLELDYSGFTSRVGIKYRFGNADEAVQTRPDIH